MGQYNIFYPVNPSECWCFSKYISSVPKKKKEKKIHRLSRLWLQMQECGLECGHFGMNCPELQILGMTCLLSDIGMLVSFSANSSSISDMNTNEAAGAASLHVLVVWKQNSTCSQLTGKFELTTLSRSRPK